MNLSSSKHQPNFTIVPHDELYFIVSGADLVWPGGFADKELAEKFISDRLTASESIEYAPDDIEFIVDNFGFHSSRGRWIASAGDTELVLDLGENTIALTAQQGKNSTVETFDTIDELIVALEEYFGDDIFASAGICDKNYTQAILAAKPSSRDMSKNLVRVKSSNLWSYGITMKDKKVGDVVIQFKGKNGGPGDVYLYYDVPVKVWQGFLGAPSKGHYFWVNIRNNYWYRKLTGDKKGRLKNAVN